MTIQSTFTKALNRGLYEATRAAPGERGYTAEEIRERLIRLYFPDRIPSKRDVEHFLDSDPRFRGFRKLTKGGVRTGFSEAFLRSLEPTSREAIDFLTDSQGTESLLSIAPAESFGAVRADLLDDDDSLSIGGAALPTF